MIRRWGRAACLAIVMNACSLGFDGEQYQGSGGGSDGPCPADALHAPAVPDGWQGPVQIATAPDEAALPSCPFISSLVHADLTGASDCACTCGVDPASKCSAYTNLYPDGANCGGVTQGVSLPAETCHSINTFGLDSGEVVWQPMGDPCVAMGLAQPTPAEWSMHTLLCAASATPMGDGSVCATPLSGFDPLICIYADGEGECPSEFPMRHQHYKNYRDERSCTPCSCSGGACGGDVVVTPGDSNCSPMNTITIPPEECKLVSGLSSMPSAIYVAEATGTCAATGGEVTGEVTPSEPLVVCCTS
jgi:hypothetical protein